MNDTIITILNSIVNALVEAIRPRVDELVDAKIKAMPDPLNGAYVTAEEFREFEAQVKELEETKVDQGELEDKVNQAVSEADFDDTIEAKTTDVVDNYDFNDKISDYLRYNDFLSESEVKDYVDARVDEIVGRKMENISSDILVKIGKALLEQAALGEKI